MGAFLFEAGDQLTSSALFNAVNAAVSKRPDSLERVFQSTSFDELHAQWLAGVRVLVVDDSDINLEVAQRILEKQGATVATCSDGLAAVEHVRVHHSILDVVLMDVQMPTLMVTKPRAAYGTNCDSRRCPSWR